KINLGPDHFSRIELGEDTKSIEDIILEAQLSRLQCTHPHLEDIDVFLRMGVASEGMKELERKELAIHATPYMLIGGELYKLGRDEVLCRCMLEHDHIAIMEEAHGGIVKGNYAGNATVCKILLAGL
ncbi:hypothetical protein KI387_013294, partial [Taxus chinensis]